MSAFPGQRRDQDGDDVRALVSSTKSQPFFLPSSGRARGGNQAAGGSAYQPQQPAAAAQTAVSSQPFAAYSPQPQQSQPFAAYSPQPQQSQPAPAAPRYDPNKFYASDTNWINSLTPQQLAAFGGEKNNAPLVQDYVRKFQDFDSKQRASYAADQHLLSFKTADEYAQWASKNWQSDEKLTRRVTEARDRARQDAQSQYDREIQNATLDPIGRGIPQEEIARKTADAERRRAESLARLDQGYVPNVFRDDWGNAQRANSYELALRAAGLQDSDWARFGAYASGTGSGNFVPWGGVENADPTFSMQAINLRNARNRIMSNAESDSYFSRSHTNPWLQLNPTDQLINRLATA